MATIKERRETAIIQLKKWCEENGYGGVENPTQKFRIEFHFLEGSRRLWQPKWDSYNPETGERVQWDNFTTFSDGLKDVEDGAVHMISIHTKGINGELEDFLDIQF